MTIVAEERIAGGRPATESEPPARRASGRGVPRAPAAAHARSTGGQGAAGGGRTDPSRRCTSRSTPSSRCRLPTRAARASKSEASAARGWWVCRCCSGPAGRPAAPWCRSPAMRSAWTPRTCSVRRAAIPRFQRLLHLYAQGFLTQVAQSTACNRLHPAEERLARWLLICRDRIGRDDIPITHETMALMLGVRRATVTEAAGTLQRQGLIRYRRGVISIVDRARLEAASCECYAIVRVGVRPPAGGAGRMSGRGATHARGRRQPSRNRSSVAQPLPHRHISPPQPLHATRISSRTT